MTAGTLGQPQIDPKEEIICYIIGSGEVPKQLIRQLFRRNWVHNSPDEFMFYMGSSYATYFKKKFPVAFYLFKLLSDDFCDYYEEMEALISEVKSRGGVQQIEAYRNLKVNFYNLRKKGTELYKEVIICLLSLIPFVKFLPTILGEIVRSPNSLSVMAKWCNNIACITTFFLLWFILSCVRHRFKGHIRLFYDMVLV